MDQDRFCGLRTYAYHLTAKPNFQRIQRTGRLDSAEILCGLAGRRDLLLARRTASVEIEVEGDRVVIRDQRPLQASKMNLEDRSFVDLLADLNRRVFFWAGGADTPGSYGESHLRRYRAEAPMMLRAPMCDLLAAGRAELCRYNSGSPRHRDGRASPRGSDAFVALSAWAGRPSDVVEVTFIGSVELPSSTQWTGLTPPEWHGLKEADPGAEAPSNRPRR